MKKKNKLTRYRQIKLDFYSSGLINGLGLGCVLFAACPTGFHIGLKFCLALLTISSIVYQFYKIFRGYKNEQKRKEN